MHKRGIQPLFYFVEKLVEAGKFSPLENGGIGESFNGRTADSDSVNLGSNPSSPTSCFVVDNTNNYILYS